jgi:serine O-acetyltransferase
MVKNQSLLKLILSDYARHDIPKNKAARFLYFFVLLLSEGFRATVLYRFAHKYRKVLVINQFFLLLTVLFVKLEIFRDAEIGPGFLCAHHQSIVIGRGSKLGKNITVHSDVTVGRAAPGGGFPVIGDNVYIGTGVKIIGPVTIGDNCTIGANAVVTKNMPANSIIAGIPAKVIKTITNTIKPE